jgi:hypothetical protein
MKKRCQKCEGCRRDDCGKCRFCRGMSKFGGQGRNRNACIQRRCMRFNESLTDSDSAQYLSSKNGDQFDEDEEISMSVPERGTSVDSIVSKKENNSKTRIKLRLVVPDDPVTTDDPEPPSSRPTPIYGVPPRSHRGVCATCFGERNEKAQNEPVLLCDGQG